MIIPEVTYGNYAVVAAINGLCLIIIVAAFIALGLYVGQRKRRK